MVESIERRTAIAFDEINLLIAKSIPATKIVPTTKVIASSAEWTCTTILVTWIAELFQAIANAAIGKKVAANNYTHFNGLVASLLVDSCDIL